MKISDLTINIQVGRSGKIGSYLPTDQKLSERQLILKRAYRKPTPPTKEEIIKRYRRAKTKNI